MNKTQRVLHVVLDAFRLVTNSLRSSSKTQWLHRDSPRMTLRCRGQQPRRLDVKVHLHDVVLQPVNSENLFSLLWDIARVNSVNVLRPRFGSE
jgi:hypothetical protein